MQMEQHATTFCLLLACLLDYRIAPGWQKKLCYCCCCCYCYVKARKRHQNIRHPSHHLCISLRSPHPQFLCTYSSIPAARLPIISIISISRWHSWSDTILRFLLRPFVLSVRCNQPRAIAALQPHEWLVCPRKPPHSAYVYSLSSRNHSSSLVLFYSFFKRSH